MQILSKSPLMEASCEILFMPSPVFDTTLPGILYTELKNEFPIKKDKPGNVVHAPNLHDERTIDISSVQLSQFFSNDNSRVVQVGKDILVNNMLMPYKGWNIFKEQILKVLDVYKSNLVEQPKIRRVTLKYLNIFVFDLTTNYNEIFNLSLPNPLVKKHKNHRAFNTIVEYDTEYKDILSLVYRTIFPPDPTKKSVTLEISNFRNVSTSINLDEFGIWLDCAHKSIEDLFVASLTSKFFHSLK